MALKLLRGTVPFASQSEDLGGFIEVVNPHAFDKTLARGDDVLARVEHDSRLLLGRRSTGTLTLKLDTGALRYEVAVPETQAGRDVAALVEAGTLFQSSFAFVVRDPSTMENWSVLPDGRLLRELLEVELVDVSPVASPAYPAATVTGRAEQLSPVSMSVNQAALRLRAQ